MAALPTVGASNNSWGTELNAYLSVEHSAGGYHSFFANAIGIGVTASSYNADADDLVLGGAGDHGLTIKAGTGSAANIFFADGTSGDAAYRGNIVYDHTIDQMYIGVEGVLGSGALLQLVGTHLAIDGGLNVGAAADPGDNNLSVAGTITAAGGQIVFPATQNASAGANTLDDYEENTWTPAITFGGAAVDIAYSVAEGFYTKIGRVVFVSGYVSLSANGSSTGVALITGLPFTVQAGSLGAGGALALQSTALSFANVAQAVFTINDTTITLMETTEAGTTTQLTNADFAATTTISLSGHYIV